MVAGLLTGVVLSAGASPASATGAIKEDRYEAGLGPCLKRPDYSCLGSVDPSLPAEYAKVVSSKSGGSDANWALLYYGEAGARGELGDGTLGVGLKWGPGHNCTLWVAWRLQRLGVKNPGSWGSAKVWGEHKDLKAKANDIPAGGAVAWFKNGDGHVAYVEFVSADGQYVYVTADNFKAYGKGYVDAGWIPISSVTRFIHIRDLPATPPLPAQPTGLKTSQVTSSSMVVSWQQANLNNVTGFVVKYSTDGGKNWSSNRTTVGRDVRSVKLSNLPANQNLTIQVGALDGPSQTRFSGYLTQKTSVSTSNPAPPKPSGTGKVFQVTNYDNDGTKSVFLRNSASLTDKTTKALPYGTNVELVCYVPNGSSVGPYQNTMWDKVIVRSGSYAGTTGYLSERWLNTPVKANQHVDGEPRC